MNFKVKTGWGSNTAHCNRISCIKLTADREFLFTSGEDRCLKQWQVGSFFSLKKDYGQVHAFWVINLQTT